MSGSSWRCGLRPWTSCWTATGPGRVYFSSWSGPSPCWLVARTWLRADPIRALYLAPAAAFAAVSLNHGIGIPSIDTIWFNRSLPGLAAEVATCSDHRIATAPLDLESVVYLTATDTVIENLEAIDRAVRSAAASDECLVLFLGPDQHADLIATACGHEHRPDAGRPAIDRVQFLQWPDRWTWVCLWSGRRPEAPRDRLPQGGCVCRGGTNQWVGNHFQDNLCVPRTGTQIGSTGWTEPMRR